MPIEFVTWLNKTTFPESQVIPDIYNEQAYNGNSAIYIKSSNGYRYKVTLKKPDEGLWYLSGHKWTEFCNDSLNDNVSLIHFIEEGDDCFYVTGYTSNGNEVGGYEANWPKLSRFMTRVLPYPNLPQSIPSEFLPGLKELDEIHIKANTVSLSGFVRRQELVLKLGTHVYELLGDTWNKLVQSLCLEAGTICVLTKKKGTQMWLEAFNNDGSMKTNVVFKGAATLRFEQIPLTKSEKRDDRMKHVCCWPFHMDHFGETDLTFYKSYPYIYAKNRLAIPAKFIKKHPMHTYQKALIIHKEYQQEMKVRMVPHGENPERKNHVNVHGKWRTLAEACRFPYTKIIRFKYMSNGTDFHVKEGENKEYPVFHIC